MITTGLQKLPVSSLRTLAGALRDGSLSSGLSVRALQQITGPQAVSVEQCLKDIMGSGMTAAQVALVVDAVADTKERSYDPALLLDLVLSGPDVPGIPTHETPAVMRALVEAAEREIILVGYAVHNGEKLFARLADRMAQDSSLRVVFCLDISRGWQDTSLDAEIVRRYTHEFKTKHWPWSVLPEVYYDPRSLEIGHEERSCLHAKSIIIDRSDALITSANFTEAAHYRNIEVGVRVRHKPLAQRLASYFEGLIANGVLKRCAM